MDRRTMRTSQLATTLLVGMHASLAAVSLAQPQSTSVQGPPVPVEDQGACPCEGCVYREWIAKETVSVRTERRKDAPVAFTVRESEKVTALTGVVISVKPGQVQFREGTTLSTSSGPLRVEPGETLYLPTYQGEGFTKAWFKGQTYRDLDATSFLNGVCEVQPSRCTGKVVENSQTEWWVQIRNGFGDIGWTDEHQKFAGKDALGAPQ